MTNFNGNVGRGYGVFRSKAGWDLHCSTGVSEQVAGSIADMDADEAGRYVKLVRDTLQLNCTEDEILAIWAVSGGKL